MEDEPISDITCFGFHHETGIQCQKQSCRQWIPCKGDLNCTVLSAKRGPKTLQQIGDIFGLTRMRVCQLEKSILKKIRRKTNAN